MNRYQKVIGGGWALAGILVLTSIAAWATGVPSLPREPVSPRSARADVSSPAVMDTASLARGATLIRSRNPFRVDRKSTNERWDPWEPVEQEAPPPPPSRPMLALVGVVGGPPWTALVEGIPGRENGVLLKIGDEVGGIRLVEIRGDTARLSGLDTLWVLTPRRAWQ